MDEVTTEDVADALEEWGASAEAVEAARAKGAPSHGQDIIVEVEPENAAAVRLFLQLYETGWRAQRVVVPAGNGGARTITYVDGLDYVAATALSSGFGIALTEQVMGTLRGLERRTLKVFRRQREAALKGG